MSGKAHQAIFLSGAGSGIACLIGIGWLSYHSWNLTTHNLRTSAHVAKEIAPGVTIELSRREDAFTVSIANKTSKDLLYDEPIYSQSCGAEVLGGQAYSVTDGSMVFVATGGKYSDKSILSAGTTRSKSFPISDLVQDYANESGLKNVRFYYHPGIPSTLIKTIRLDDRVMLSANHKP